MRLYLAGPMSGIKDFNFPVFLEAAKRLRAEGHHVFSPAERDLEIYGEDVCKSETGSIIEASKKGFSLRDAMLDDVTFICRMADGVAMLPGWENSKGARAEHQLAEALGLEIRYL